METAPASAIAPVDDSAGEVAGGQRWPGGCSDLQRVELSGQRACRLGFTVGRTRWRLQEEHPLGAPPVLRRE